MCANVPSILPL